MTRKEAIRQTQQQDQLRSLGFTIEETEALRRISMTLHHWYELECGTDSYAVVRGQWNTTTGEFDYSEDGTGQPHYEFAGGSGRSRYQRIPDRETGAIKRLKAIITARNDRHKVRQTACVRCGLDIEGWADDPNIWRDRGGNIHCPDGKLHAMNTSTDSFDQLSYYLQTDPRGAALYIIRPGDVPDGGDVSSYYSRGICVF